MNEFQPVIDELYREEVRRARELGAEGRFRTAVEITEINLEWAQALEEGDRKRRYRIARALDEHGCYGPPAPRL